MGTSSKGQEQQAGEEKAETEVEGGPQTGPLLAGCFVFGIRSLRGAGKRV